MDYFSHEIVPLLGPTPQEFKSQGLKPCTFFSDDHTPIELIWAIEADGKMSIRFAMEPLDSLDGTPSPTQDWMTTLYNLRSWHRTKAWSLEWTNVCRETLILDRPECGERAQYLSQFFFGEFVFLTEPEALKLTCVQQEVTFHKTRWLENFTFFPIFEQRRPMFHKKTSSHNVYHASVFWNHGCGFSRS